MLASAGIANEIFSVFCSAHVMPQDQLHAQLAKELGEDWRDKFEEFDDVPIAAASIGQVHRATLATGERVAVKIQYPGVADSIESDLTNLKRLVTYTNILPKGLYIDEIIRVGQEELTAECNYAQEAENQEKFRQLIHDVGMDDRFVVPKVHREVSTARVLATELISGVAIDKCVNLSQELRDSIGRRVLELTVRELFDWRFMQTDPNWSNFMYNSATDKIGLVDFGAAREYPEEFVNEYFKIVWAAANNDEKTLVDCSIKMNFLTGDESPAMIRAHTAAGMVVGEPFRSHEPFDFYESQLTKRLAQYTETFMDSRLTAPPQEAYSLHRKLAGAFLICIKLRARVPCRDVLEEIHAKYATPNTH
jgi:aarF domain-containing kinase